MLDVKLFPLAGVFLTLLLVDAACSPAPLPGGELGVTTTPTVAVARHRVPERVWNFLAKERGVATGHGASFAVQFVVMELRDPMLITVIYTLAAEPGIGTGQKQLTPVDDTSLIDHRAELIPGLGSPTSAVLTVWKSVPWGSSLIERG